MSTRERTTVVIIGGGVVGCAVLYHLARRGLEDAILLERQELTAGSSWHAAGNLAALTQPANAATLQKYTIEHYSELEEESGQPCGVHIVGGIYLSRSTDQTHQLQRMDTQAKRSDVETRFISAKEAQELAPILNTDGVEQILYEPLKGYCDPASVTNAFAKAARRYGAEIRRHTPVRKTEPTPAGTWEVHTDKGVIEAQYLVNAAGLWGREVAALAGLRLPLIPVEHHYFVTENLPELEALENEIAHISELGGGYYLRQEAKGLLLGIYEDKCTLWAENGTPLDFGHELLPDDLSRAEKVIDHVTRAIPALLDAGIKRVINGPMILTPDLAPVVGPHPHARNYFCANGVMSGFNQGGGIGRILSDWILDGEPSMDVHFWDIARFGDWADGDFVGARVKYGYEHRQKVYYPHEEVDVARGLLTSKVHGRLIEAGAVHGAVFGMEHPLWYAHGGEEQQDHYDFYRGNWFDAVGRECKPVRGNVGLIDVSAFAKYRIAGPNAEGWLDRLLANRLPAKIGKTTLSPMLTPAGRMIADFTVTRLGEKAFLLLGSGIMQVSHMRWFKDHLPKEGGVTVENITLERGGIHLAGPKSRDLLQSITTDSIEAQDFEFLSAKPIEITGVGTVLAVRVSFTGELGYELYCPKDIHASTFNRVREAGRAFDLRLVGGRAMGSMRIEKGFGSWGSDFSPDFTPFESGMDRFIRPEKGPFIGREAFLEIQKAPINQHFRQMVVDTEARDCFGGEAIFQDGAFMGHVTSAAFGHATGKSLALGYVKSEALNGAPLEIDLLGERVTARVTQEPVYDPKGIRMRL